MADDIKLEFDTKQLTDEQKKKLQDEFEKSQKHEIVKQVELRSGEMDVRQMNDGDFKQMIFRWMAETEELLISIAQSSNDLLLANVERLSPKQKARYDNIVNNREAAFKEQAEKALAEKKHN